MNNKLSIRISTLVAVGIFLLYMTVTGGVTAQYSGQGNPGSVTLEEQLQLAKEKITNAQQQGAYGSGTAMFGTNLDNTLFTIVIITVIMGGISAAFFAAGGMKRSAKTAILTSQKGIHDDEAYKQVSQQVDDLKKVIEDLQKKLINANHS